MASSSMASAVRTILLADLVMSVDNVIAVAAAAKGSTVLLIVGLAISIPLVVFASRLLLTVMDRVPVIITLGAALLGWVAGEMAVTDPVAKGWVDAQAAVLYNAASAVVPASCITPHRRPVRSVWFSSAPGWPHAPPVLPARWCPCVGRMRQAGCSASCSRWMAPKERHKLCAT